ncbi:MAG: transposase [Acetobacteraceae bacterium]|nr:transposase [Acetobacteraceae bacterium]
MAKIAQPGNARAIETWLAPFAALFTQPTWLNAVALATGALLCLNRRTVCAALRAVDGASDKGFSRFHRFLSRGAWSGLQGSRILLGLLVAAFVPDGQALVVGVDDSIERRRGGTIRDKGIYRDPVRSSRGFFVKVEGLRWLSFQVLAKPGFARRTWGLPFLTVLCPSERAAAKRQRRHQTVPEKAMWGMRLIARWLPHRRLVMVGDGAFASLAVFRTLRGRAACVARCRMDARLFNPPPPRKTGQKGRPPLLGTRQLTPRTRAVRTATKWMRMTVPGWRAKDGATDRDVDVATGTALWNSHGMTVPVRWVLTRDPAGRAETRAFVCSDPARTASEILTWYAMRWAVEVTFAETRRHLGIETQRQWSDLAIQRTTPLLLGLFSLVTLWACELAARTSKLPVLGAAWHKNPDPTFADCLAAVRRLLWAEEAVRPILWRDDCPTWRPRPRTAEKPRPINERLAELMSYAA